MSPIKITWLDSGLHLDEGWAPVTEYVARAKDHGSTVTTVGLLVFEDEEMVVIGLSRDLGTDNIFGAQVIFKQNIKERIDL